MKKHYLYFPLSLLAILIFPVALTSAQLFPEKPSVRFGKGGIQGIAYSPYSPDGELLAVVGRVSIRLYRTEDLTEIALLEGHTDTYVVWDVAFSPDGEMLASAGEETIRLWDVKAHRQVTVLQGHTGTVFRLAFSPDGRILASKSTGPEDKSRIRLWSTATWQQIGSLQTNTSRFAFSPNGEILASIRGNGSTIQLWDVATQQQVGLLDRGLRRDVYVASRSGNTLAFSPDGLTLASGHGEGLIILWDVESQQQVGQLGPIGFVTSVAFSPDGRVLASGSSTIDSSSGSGYSNLPDNETSLRLWDVQSHQQIGMLKEHENAVRLVTFNPANGTLASLASDRTTVRFWNIDTQDQIGILEHTTHVSAVFSPDGATLAMGGSDGILLWDIGRQQQVGRLGKGTPLDFSPDGKFLLAGKFSVSRVESGLELWNVEQQQLIEVWDGVGGHIFSPGGRAAFSPDGTVLASLCWLCIWVWDMQAQELIGLLKPGGRFTPLAIAFSPDGHVLASGDREGTVRLWDVGARRQIEVLPADGPVTSVAFSPDGEVIAYSSGTDGTVRLWQVAAKQLLGILEMGNSWVRSVVFSPDGRFLAVGVGFQGLEVWDIAVPQQVAIRPNGGTPDAFSPDGRWLASTRVSTVLLWDIRGDDNPPEPPAAPWDINHDGRVDVFDLVQVAAQFGKRELGLSGDVNGDGEINIFDLVAVSSHFGEDIIATAPTSFHVTLSGADHHHIREALRELELTRLRTDEMEIALRFLRSVLRNARPTHTEVFSNYPNPFNPETWMPFTLAQPCGFCVQKIGSLQEVDDEGTTTFLDSRPVYVLPRMRINEVWRGHILVRKGALQLSASRASGGVQRESKLSSEKRSRDRILGNQGVYPSP